MSSLRFTTGLIAGEFSGSLSNGGEQITFQKSDNFVVRDFTCDDNSPCPESPDDVEYQVEITDDLAVWESGSGHVEHVSSTNNGDGTLTVVYRSADPMVAGIQEYFRLGVISRS